VTSSAPKAALTATPSQVTTGGSVTLDASASTAGTGRTITSYRFLCGNGSRAATLTTPTKSCTYSNAGSYTATVTVTDDLGQTAKANAAVTVTATSKPTARLTVSPTTARRGQAITADASASTGATSYSFKCGSQARTAYGTSSTKTCKFFTSGTTTQTITVWVKNSAGLVSSTSKSVTVTP
jgi:serine protease